MTRSMLAAIVLSLISCSVLSQSHLHFHAHAHVHAHSHSHPLPPRRRDSLAGSGSGSGSVRSDEDFLDVLDYGAKGDNATDNTKAFQDAIDAAAAAGGIQVYVPGGLYKFAGNLTVTAGVTLQGSFVSVPSHQFPDTTTPMTDGTVLIPTHGRGIDCDVNCTDAFILVHENGAVRGLVIYYQEQEKQNLPVGYPWSIYLVGNNAAVEDVELLGAWNGIAAVQAHRHYIARVQGQPVNIGVFVDQTYDIGRLEDIHFNPWFSNQHPFVYHQTNFGVAFIFARSDWEYAFNLFAFGYAVGYKFVESSTGSMNGNFLGIGADLMTNASILVEQSQSMGLLITNGEFTAFCDADHGFCGRNNTAPRHVVVEATNNGAVKFVNSAFWGPAAQIAQVDGQGTVTFSQCHFQSWDMHEVGGKYVQQGSAAITQVGGNLIVTNADFTQNFANQTHLEVLSGGAKTIFTANIIDGPLAIKGQASVKHIVANNADM